MSPGDRCDEIIKLIDETLGDAEVSDDPSDEVGSVEAPTGTWGVYYLRPS